MAKVEVHAGNLHALANTPDAFDSNQFVIGIAHVRQLIREARADGYAACQAELVAICENQMSDHAWWFLQEVQKLGAKK